MRILTGVQPSGIPHLGNYFGAMRQVCALQEKGESFLFIADYHSLTTSPDPETLRKNIVNLALDFIACGVDLERTVFFRQSAVPQVCELAWILSNVTPVGFLERAHSYKDKIAKGFSPNCGLFTYPILMAADILLYGADLVPVGKDGGRRAQSGPSRNGAGRYGHNSAVERQFHSGCRASCRCAPFDGGA